MSPDALDSKSYSNHPFGKPRPQVVTASAALLYAVLAMICITSSERLEGTLCPYNGNKYACLYPIVIGQLSVVILIGYIAINIVDLKQCKLGISNRYHGSLLLVDIFISGILTLLWLITLCYLADQWRRADIPDDYRPATAQAGIAFTLFCWFAFAVNTFLSSVQYYHKFYRSGEIQYS